MSDDDHVPAIRDDWRSAAERRDMNGVKAPSSENLTSELLPGGSLIAAALDRQVMIWSDRGGASRHIGDRWALQCADALQAAVGRDWPAPGEGTFRLIEVVRLDDIPQVSREANLHHLENPDFLLAGQMSSSRKVVLQAADAKFAADRIKPSQVSAAVVLNLLAIEGGATARLVDEMMGRIGLSSPEIVRGVFISPQSVLTDHLLRRVTTGSRAIVDPEEVVTIPPDPATMFAGLAPSRAIGPLARIDALPVTPRANLISAIYYFRLACGCFFLWGEENRPLLGGAPIVEPEPGVVVAEIVRRAERARSAFELLDRWAADTQTTVQAREAVANVATLPVRMRDLRALVERAGLGGESRALRTIRRDLERAFRSRLLAEIGEISADDPRPLSAILDDVARVSRKLAPEMHALLNDLVVSSSSGEVGNV